MIILLLIFLLLSNKVSENFTNSQALDAVKSTEKKVNDMFYEVDANWNKSDKGILSKKSIEAESHIVSRKGNVTAKVDVTAGLNVTAKVDVIAGGNVTAKVDVIADRNMTATGNVKGKKLCIGNTCLDENHLKMLTDGFHFKNLDGHYSDNWIHAHDDGRIGPAKPQYKTKFKMFRE